MNIHEYQAKEILRSFGAPVPRGKPAFSVEEAAEAARELAKDASNPVVVVKAQIHAGGRGKGGGGRDRFSNEDYRDSARQPREPRW